MSSSTYLEKNLQKHTAEPAVSDCTKVKILTLV